VEQSKHIDSDSHKEINTIFDQDTTHIDTVESSGNFKRCHKIFAIGGVQQGWVLQEMSQHHVRIVVLAMSEEILDALLILVEI
jgi:hypothetical protein